MAEVQGVCDERFGAVRQALAESLDQDDVGASAAVYLDGDPVADIWGGYADAARTMVSTRSSAPRCAGAWAMASSTARSAGAAGAARW